MRNSNASVPFRRFPPLVWLSQRTKSRRVINDHWTYVSYHQVAFGSPAAEAQLKNGDLVVKINGVDTHRLTHQKAHDLIKNAGSTISLLINRSALREIQEKYLNSSFLLRGRGGGESAPATSTDTLANSKCVTATTIYVCGPPELGATRVPATLHHRLRLLRPMPIKYVCANNRTGRLNRIVFDWSSPLVASSRSTRNRHSTKFRIMFVFFFGTAFLMVLF